MRSKKNRPVDLYVLGLGLRGLEQATRETLSVLSRCRAVFHYGEPHAELARLCSNTVDLTSHYWTGEDRSVVYRRLAKLVLAEVEKGPGVASVTYGHPLLFDDVHASLVRSCRRRGLHCRVLPAVSCLDALSIDLNIDYGDPGLVVFEATDLVMNRRRMLVDLHTLVLQVGAFDVHRTTDTIADARGMFDSFDRYLLRFYPRGHQMHVCYSDDGEEQVRFSARIGNMRRREHRIFPGTTLYIPPVP